MLPLVLNICAVTARDGSEYNMEGFAKGDRARLLRHRLYYQWREVGKRGAGSRLYADGMELGAGKGHPSLQGF